MLKELRKNNRISQEFLATVVGVSQSTISQIEQGRIKPSVPLAKKIATVLGCNWTDFFEDAGEEDDSKTKTF